MAKISVQQNQGCIGKQSSIENGSGKECVNEWLVLSEPPQYVYHYTSMQTIHALLENLECPSDAICSLDRQMSFHASSAFYMNDKLEYNGLDTLGYQGISDFNRQFAQGVKGLPYILSLSAHSDAALMWKMYGDCGKGVSLCFDSQKLDAEVKRCNKSDFMETRLAMCKYYKKGKSPSLFSEFASTNANVQQREAMQRMSVLPFYKNDEWEYEKECRLMIWANFDACQKMRGDEMVSYYKLRIPLKCLKSITAGSCVSDKTFDCLRQLVSKAFKGTCDADLPTIIKSESTLTSQS